ncbi:MAG TPA: bifunctional diaminohydroxyphosphoribosylaminopyrimidine deaminase/5-amino-6-(5-phosphoribosylamino)uracil reductase RibD [Puia sp.]|nr:bifunctional diaminohydroxyphosphoribosylaminopyrimidine deaminase/5-amino-6-(5-phosphoribosylamino)uracil reductase RibD [Puia sp.]
MNIDETYMHRCLELAKLGAGYVAPNPMVGAVLVHNEKIIGEGYHQTHGQAHAEVNCINSVSEENKDLISRSTLYVSLEPCVHHGKTPPCTDLILQNKIPKVVVGCRDPFDKVNGKGIDKLKNAGVEVVRNILEKECIELNKRFFTFYQKHRPYIILKWAQSGNAKIATSPKDLFNKRIFISNEFTNRLVHKWRSEESAILVGTNTALRDDPELTTRLWQGKNPTRLIIDINLNLPKSLKIFNGQAHTIIFNSVKQEQTDNVSYYQLTNDGNIVHQITNALYQLNIQSVIIEGGAKTLRSFIDEKMWDEARIITNEELIIENGLAAPELENFKQTHSETILTDRIHYYQFVQ